MTPSISSSRKRSGSITRETEPPAKVVKILSALPTRMVELDENDVSPQEYLMQIVKAHNAHVEIKNSLDVDNFFASYTKEEIEAYDADVLRAINAQDIETLKEFHKNGRPLKCSNRFGESLLHLACRRNFVNVAKFLIQQAHVPVRVRDDFGRTILHDAAWTCEPNFELIKLILMECPDLLYMSDRRGHTPTSYARKSHWSVWNKFLKERADLVIPGASTSSIGCNS